MPESRRINPRIAAAALTIVAAFAVGLPVSATVFTGQRAETERAVRAHGNEVVSVAAWNASVAAIEFAGVRDLAGRQGAEAAPPVLAAARDLADRVTPFPPLIVEVAPGETWLALSQRWGLSAVQLATMNPEVDLNLLAAGQRITVSNHQFPRRTSSVGTPQRGRLLRGVQMPEGEHWVVRNADRAWATPETIGYLSQGMREVAVRHPGGGRPIIGNISLRNGGRFPPHRSHRSGRDVDGSYYRLDADRTSSFGHTSRTTLDVRRQWTLFRHWIAEDAVTHIFVDTRLIRALHAHAVAIGDDPELVELAFGERGYGGLIRHERGHADHYHARFRCAPYDEACRD